MGQVNRIPNGFLDLLGVESLGKNPPLYSDAISPTVDLTELYSAQTLSSHTEDFSHTAIDDQVVIFVPEGETWLLRAVGFRSGILTNTNEYEMWEFSLDSLPRGNTGGATSEPGIWTSKRVINQLVGGARESDDFTLPAPLALTAGVALRAKLLIRDTSGARTTALNWLFNRFNS